MLTVGQRSNPSVLNLILIVIVIIAILVYGIISLSTGDLMWFSNRFTETPNGVIVHCFGNTIEFNPGSYQFGALTEIMNETMSGQKRYDSLSMSLETYQDYQQHPGMVAIEFFYPTPIRVHSEVKFYSNVDNLIIPLEGRHAQTNAVFGQNNGTPTAGSLHVDSTERLKEFLRNQKICQVTASTQ
jgi:hypothetical protein